MFVNDAFDCTSVLREGASHDCAGTSRPGEPHRGD